jgi:hypothetical protein
MYEEEQDEQLIAYQQAEQLEDLEVNLGFWRRAPLSGSLPITDIIKREAYQLMTAFEFNQTRFFIPANQVARENIRYHKGHQYSAEDTIKTLAQNRKPYRFNQIEQFVRQFCGEQRGQRTDMLAIPRTDISATFAEAMNHYMRWVCYKNKWHDTHSDIFLDGIVGGWGVATAYLDPRNPFANPILERVYPFEMMWDIATASNARLDGTNFLWRGNFDTVANMIDQFPESAEIIRRNGGAVDRNMYAFHTTKQPVISSITNRPTLDTTYQTWNDLMNPNMIFRREFYHRRYEHRWVVRDGTTNTEEVFLPNRDGSCPQEAIDFAQAALQFYQDPYIIQEFDVQTPLVSRPFPKQVAYVDKYVFAGSALIFFQTYQTDQYPYKFFIPTWQDGELTSYIESLKDPQRFVNRLLMFIDEEAGGAKGGAVVNKRYLDGSWEDDDIKEYAVQTNPVWITDKDPADFKIEDFIHTYGPPPGRPEAPMLLQHVESLLDRLGGGSNIIGGAAFAGQSGKSAEALTAAAGITHIPVYDKDNFFQEDVGKLIISYAPKLDPSIRMFVTNEYREPSATSFLEHKLGTVFKPEDLDFGIEIAEVIASQDKRERQFAKFAMMMQTTFPNDIAGQQAAMPSLIKNSGLEASEQRDFLTRYEEITAQMNQAAAEQAKFDRDMEVWKMEQGQEKINVSRYGYDVQRELALKLNITGSLEEMGPAAQATMWNKMGIPADPGTIMEDNALQSTMQQAERNIAHANFNALTPKWEREKGSRTAKGVPTPKDRMNRQTPKAK